MFSVIQTNYQGIDGLTFQQSDMPKLTDDGVLIKMHVFPVVPSDWKRESQSGATKEQLTGLPRVIGFGGVGEVVAVGAQRDQQLLHHRVLVMHPQGAYSEYLVSNEPDFIFPLPATVNDEAAAALLAGAGTAEVLKTVALATQQPLILTGANSVIGQYLLQMLRGTQCQITPLVTATSQGYFQQQLPDYHSQTLASLKDNPQPSIVLDIVGQEPLLAEISRRTPVKQIVSVALQQADTSLPLRFVHEEFVAANYRRYIRQLANGELIAPIDRVFPVTQIKTAQHYAKESHSRGRVLVQFNQTKEVI